MSLTPWYRGLSPKGKGGGLKYAKESLKQSRIKEFGGPG